MVSPMAWSLAPGSVRCPGGGRGMMCCPNRRGEHVTAGDAIDQATTMWELVEARAAATPDVVALYDGEDREITFAQLRDRAERVAAGLHAEGIGAGSRVT